MTFGLELPRKQFETAMLILSVDVDVGARELGILNEGKNDAYVHKYLSEAQIGEIEEHALPLFVDAFSEFEVPATFAVRGQLAALDNGFLDLLLTSPVKHDIGAHGYSHKNFKHLKREEAEEELALTAAGFKKLGVTPKSFVFPRNGVRHLDVLESFGYKCYRERGTLRSDGMFIEKKGSLYNVQPSLYLSPSVSPFILEKILNVAVNKKVPLHLWFHMWNFGTTRKQIEDYVENIFSPFLEHARKKEKAGLLTFETMLSAANKAEYVLPEIL
ncbi:MAG: polysaccharide deacetylase family protein [Candidatus Bathyarchaeota archaeon]|nr:polysaccharide deacetylase family protein [Candidatus Bathyarchaeota archaeon]